MSLSACKKNIKYFLAIQKVFIISSLIYRSDYITNTISSYGWTFLQLVFLKVLYSGVSDIYGWNFFDILILLSMGQIAYYIFWMFAPGANSYIGDSITNGELDGNLLKPLNPIFSMSAKGSGFINMMPSLILQSVILFYGFTEGREHTTYLQVLLCIFTLGISLYLTFIMSLIFNLLSFFAPYLHEGLLNFYGEIHDIQSYPSEIFSKFFSYIFLFILPLGLTSYVPAKILIKEIDINLIILQILSSIFLFSITLYVWKKGLKNYTSVSG